MTTSWEYSNEFYKNYTRETWDECAENYLPLMKQLAPFHNSMIELIQPKRGEKVLDVCTGPGEPAMTIASLVGPDGHVTGVDLSATMTTLARKSAAKRGLHNVEFVSMDAERLEFPPNTFDIAVSCFGFQIVTRPETAAKEVLRVLKPGGRAGFTVWSTGDKTPAIDVIIRPMLEHATPDEDGYLPTPYELGGPGELVDMLDKIGFTNSTERRSTGIFIASSVEEYLKTFLVGTPILHSLSEESDDIQKTVLAKARSNIACFSSTDGVVIPAECVLVRTSKQL